MGLILVLPALGSDPKKIEYQLKRGRIQMLKAIEPNPKIKTLLQQQNHTNRNQYR